MLLSSSQEQTIALLTFVIWEKLHFTFCYDVIIYACQFNFFKWPQWCYTKYIKVSFESDELRGEVLTVFFSAVASINASKWVNPKGNQTWIFMGRTDAEAKTPILWLPDSKSQLTGKVKDMWYISWSNFLKCQFNLTFKDWEMCLLMKVVLWSYGIWLCILIWGIQK